MALVDEGSSPRPMFYQCRECGVDRDVALEDRHTLQDGAVICLKCFDEQAQAAASLRQRLEMADKQSEGDERVRHQLTQSVHFWLNKAEEAEVRASQAEAALEEMQKLVDGLKRGDCWCEVAIGNPMYRGEHSPICLELQRRRSPTGQL